jgi:hypothetical protein
MKNLDKLLHFLAGFFITTVLLAFTPDWVAVGAAVLAGVGKEVYDVYKGGKFDLADLACTFAGGFGAWWVSLLLWRVI